MDQKVPETIKIGVLKKARQMEIDTIPTPKVGEYDVLVRQEACNICTTDYGQWLGLREHQGYPMAGGHEGSGIIVAKGSKVGNELEVGDRVGLSYSYCGECKACRLGHTIECTERDHLVGYTNKSELGYYGTYGYADYIVRKAKYLIKMSKELTPSEVGFLEPVATVVNGMKKLRVKPMETVVVIGAGTMGLINAQVARAFGARVIVSEILEKKLNCAEEMGFEVIDASTVDPVAKAKELTDGGPDAVIIAVGATKANEQALEMVKDLDGRVLFFAAGFPAPALQIDSNIIHYRKLELIGAFEADQQDFYDSATLLNHKHINVKPLIESTFPFEEIQQAFEAASVEGSYRVSIEL